MQCCFVRCPTTIPTDWPCCGSATRGRLVGRSPTEAQVTRTTSNGGVRYIPFLAGNWEDHIEDEVQLWAPLTTNPSDEPSASGSLNVTRSPGKARFQVVGRLKPTVSIGTAQNEMNTIAGRLAGEYPDSNKTLGVRVRRLDEYIAGEMRRPLLLLSLCVLLLLLIACTNLATLSLARGVARARELAVRAAIGATRMRLVRQLLTESALLAILAGGT